MISLIEEHRAQVDDLWRRFHVKRLELFGSAASGEFVPGKSDLDFFVGFCNQIIHGSAVIQDAIRWKVIKEHLPVLVQSLLFCLQQRDRHG